MSIMKNLKIHSNYSKEYQKEILSKETSEYNKQALKFLFDTNTGLHVIFSRCGIYGSFNDNEPRNIYECMLFNETGRYNFTFGDSISNTENNKTPDAYSVLACLGNFYPDSFDDFCSEFGYTFSSEKEYLKIKSIHMKCKEEEEAIINMFSEEELEQLQEIR
jgi:hypothetical protein